MNNMKIVAEPNIKDPLFGDMRRWLVYQTDYAGPSRYFIGLPSRAGIDFNHAVYEGVSVWDCIDRATKHGRG